MHSRGADAPAVARIETDVATMMQAMRGEIYIPEVKSRIIASGDEAVIEHFMNSIIPGAAVAEEVARKIAASASLHA